MDDTVEMGWQFDNTYLRLPAAMFVPAAPAAFSAPRTVILNHRLANDLELDFGSVPPATIAALLSGQLLPPGAEPIAQAYAGHQFGGFTMLGDGRAILLGEHVTSSGRRVDIQLKGAGPTAYSRRGDGLAALGPMLREYIVSEGMAALRIPTTRSLAVVHTGEKVFRASTLRGAVLTRVAASHIRFGTFEYAAARLDRGSLQAIADYSIERHYPELTNEPQKYVELLRRVTDRQAALIAQWQLVGFIHGVMNTDNMAISGETIDYGPCAFLNAYNPQTVFSSIDREGRYAFGNQPAIGQWNVARFAESLLPLLAPEEEEAVAVATECVFEFAALFERYWLSGMRKKLGLLTEEAEDASLVRSFLEWMSASRSDFTNTFRSLSSGSFLSSAIGPAGARPEAEVASSWYARWLERVDRESRPRDSTFAAMQSVNPAVIPRNHLVEAALSAAEHDDLAPLNRLLSVLAEPFKTPADASFAQPPANDAGYQTFCGT